MIKMRIVILTNNQANQIALCNRIAEKCEISAIVFSKNIPKKSPGLFKKARFGLNRIAGRTIGREFVNLWFKMLEKYAAQNSDLPDVEVANVENVNDSGTLRIIEKHEPDLVVVSGTNLVGRKIIEASQKRRGIVNLHTGISPYVKGGPNCTNWCLAKNWFHLIGSTVMWLDPGIDSGDIIATEQTPLDGSESLFDLHWKVMEHAGDLYVRTLLKIAGNEKIFSIPQNQVGEGTTFYTADWNAKAMWQASKNFKKNYANYFYEAGKRAAKTKEINLFPINI